ncbi:hypothetical protein Mp_7g11180 [Marchantia polymorpha subsp. ruderalis]|uniref:Uncharacterized protein n=2 Tax=Marchantia polymorpha TaxID=3197 RepID=A0AAF6BYC1_MARPO|nr:hypothetical protein MARPO_0003s0132 [Marchantia polymorpha]BBN17005.1 hypothetical protein Mp_7g11180 [Marchantia polymorpha subsp. ruderalis]|eukprot:PTQ49241.1 hypothetical protein MARPO_0003s0132 [Marchantia polymorpha]
MAQAEAPLKPMAAAETATSPKQVTIKEGAPTVMPEPAPGGAPAGIPMAQTEIPTEKTVDNAGALVPHEASRSAPTSPGAPTATKSGTDMSPGKKGSNLKAEAFADAHSKRVETEAQAYLESEIRKAEAHAERLSAKAEKDRMNAEAKALEARKKEDQRADQLVHATEIKVDKIMSQAKEKALLIKASAQEEAEKLIADANTKAQRTCAETTELNKREVAVIEDKVAQMKAAGEFPLPQHKGLGQKIKAKFSGHHH